MRCETCGAELPQGRTICEFCGSSWDRVLPAAVASQSCDGSVYDRIKESRVWADRHSPLRHGRLPQMPALATVAPLIFLILFVGISAFIAFMALGISGILGFAGFRLGGPIGAGFSLFPAFMAVVPIGFVVLGIFMFQKQRQVVRDFQTAPTATHAAVIAGKRTQVSGGGEHSSASTHYFLTAQFEDGRREEFAVMASDLYGRVSQGDAGVLFVRGTFALDFDRVA